VAILTDDVVIVRGLDDFRPLRGFGAVGHRDIRIDQVVQRLILHSPLSGHEEPPHRNIVAASGVVNRIARNVRE
jgi:hypothetical protein